MAKDKEENNTPKFYGEVSSQLELKLKNELKNNSTKTLLIQGEYGVGKTTFTRSLTEKLFKDKIQEIDCDLIDENDESFFSVLRSGYWKKRKKLLKRVAKYKLKTKRKDGLTDKVSFVISAFLTILIAFLTIVMGNQYVNGKFNFSIFKAVWFWIVISLMILMPTALSSSFFILSWIGSNKTDCIIIDNIDRKKWDFIIKTIATIEGLKSTNKHMFIVAIFDIERLNVRYKEKFGFKHENIIEEIEKTFDRQINLNEYAWYNIDSFITNLKIQDKDITKFYTEFIKSLKSNNQNILNFRNMTKLYEIFSLNWESIKQMKLNPMHFLIIQYIRLTNDSIFRIMGNIRMRDFFEGQLSLAKLKEKRLSDKLVSLTTKKQSSNERHSSLGNSLGNPLIFREIDDVNSHEKLFNLLVKFDLLYLVERINQNYGEDKFKRIDDEEYKDFFFYTYKINALFQKFQYFQKKPITLKVVDDPKETDWLLNKLYGMNYEEKSKYIIKMSKETDFNKIENLGKIHSLFKKMLPKTSDWLQFVCAMNSNYNGEKDIETIKNHFILIIFLSFVYNNYVTDASIETRRENSILDIVLKHLDSYGGDLFQENTKKLYVKNKDTIASYYKKIRKNCLNKMDEFNNESVLIGQFNKIAASVKGWDYFLSHQDNFKIKYKDAHYIDGTNLRRIFRSESEKVEKFLGLNTHLKEVFEFDEDYELVEPKK